jgi:hypothetical protein
MNTVVESLETVLIEAYKVRGWKWCQEEPMWTTWPLEKFGASSLHTLKHSSSLPPLPPHLHPIRVVTEIPRSGIRGVEEDFGGVGSTG